VVFVLLRLKVIKLLLDKPVEVSLKINLLVSKNAGLLCIAMNQFLVKIIQVIIKDLESRINSFKNSCFCRKAGFFKLFI